MKVFISYAREQERVAQQIYATLSNQRYDVFLDVTRLKGGMEFAARIHDEIKQSELMVCLISPSYIEDRTWARTEVKIAKEKWSGAHGHVLPVMVEPTSIDDVDPFLESVGIVHPEGNVAAEVLMAIRELGQGSRRPDGKDVSEALLLQRLSAYKALWALTDALPKWPRSDSVTYQRLFDLSRVLRDWYFGDGGGMFLSRDAHTAYAAVQNELTAILARRGDGLISIVEYDQIRDLCSALRTRMAADVGTRGADFSAET